MPDHTTKPAILSAAFAVAITASAAAAPSTPQGLISAAQVNQMLEKAQTDGTARQVLTAYLAGVGEAVSASVRQAACQTHLSLSADNVRQALGTVSGRDADQTPATALIVRNMLNRAGCKGQ